MKIKNKQVGFVDVSAEEGDHVFPCLYAVPHPFKAFSVPGPVRKDAGFTLIEMMLVAVVIAIILYGSISYVQQRALQMRIDRTSTQMQQIMNAGLSYYVANGAWPDTLDCLKGGAAAPCATIYLPSTTALQNAWGEPYEVVSNTTPGSTVSPAIFYVYTKLPASTSGGNRANATVIAGTLPLSYTSQAAGGTGSPPAIGTDCTVGADCYVVAGVNIPGQNINSARAVNFAGLYKHGGCVPVPVCPVDATGTTMTPEVMVVPVSVSGVNDPNTNNVYPISSFTAYATAEDTTGTLGDTPLSCTIPGSTPSNQPCTGVAAPSKQYWRACLQVVTEKGNVAETSGSASSPLWGANVTLMAITRCAVTNEPSGSDFTVFTQ